MAALRMTPEDLWATTNNSGGRYGAPPQPVGAQYPVSPESAAMKANAGDALTQSRLRAEQRAQPKVGPAPTAAAGGAAPPVAPPVAPAAPGAAPEPVKKGGWFTRTAAGIADAPGKGASMLRGAGNAAMNGDIIAGGAKVAGALAPVARAAGKVAAPVGIGMSAAGSYNTSTDEYRRRLGIDADTDSGVAKEVGVRSLGVMQDLGNNLTFGVADRVGNLISGNGFNRSAGNQVGEVFGPGTEVGGGKPAGAAPTAPTTADPTAQFPPNRGGQPGGTVPGTGVPAREDGKIYRDGNSYSGTGTITSGDIVNARNPGVGVSVLDMSEGRRQDALELARLRERPQSVTTGDGGSTLGQGAIGFGGSGMGGLSGRKADRALRLREAEMSNETQRLNNETNNRTLLRGQDIQAETARLPGKLAAERRKLMQQYVQQFKDPAAAQAAALSNGDADIAENLGKGVTTMQSQSAAQQAAEKANADRARGKFNGRFNTLVPGGLEGEALTKAQRDVEDEAHNLARQTYPGFDQMGDTEQNKVMPKIMGMLEVIKKTGKVDRGGVSGILPDWMTGQAQFAPTSALRGNDFFQGAQLEAPIGGVRGLLPFVEKGQTFMELAGGRGQVDLGQLSEEGKSFLRSQGAK